MVSKVFMLAFALMAALACDTRIPLYLTAPAILDGASIKINGQVVGTLKDADGAGSIGNLMVEAGEHLLVIEQEGFAPIELPIDYEKGREGYVSIDPHLVVRIDSSPE